MAIDNIINRCNDVKGAKFISFNFSLGKERHVQQVPQATVSKININDNDVKMVKLFGIDPSQVKEGISFRKMEHQNIKSMWLLRNYKAGNEKAKYFFRNMRK